ncbi:MAG: hypothetical protein NTW16_05460 [Bacteroidetes bacterium]|nr:hypothetical protein [Bacteroidota bacterium]
MGNSKKRFSILLTVVCIYFILIRLIFGFTYESNDDPAFENMLRGVYWNTPISNFYFYYRGIALVFIWLYQYFDIGVNWYGISLITGNMIACLLFSIIILKKTGNYYLVGLFFLIYLQSTFLVSFTRVSILLSFASLLTFVWAGLFRHKKMVLLFSLLSFLWAFLMRPNAGILSMALIVPFLFTHEALTTKFIKNLAYAFIPVLIGLIISNSVSRFQDRDFTRMLNQAATVTFPILDYGYPVKVSDEKQKALLFEIQNWFFFNVETISPDHLKYFKNTPINSIPDATKVLSRLIDIGRIIFYKPIFFFLILAFLIFYVRFKLYTLLNSIMLLYFLGLILSIGILLKVEYRVIIPVISIFLFFVFLFFSMEILPLLRANKKFYFIFLSLLSLASILQFSLYYKKTHFNILPENLLLNASIDSFKTKKIILLKDPTFNFLPLRYVPMRREITLIPATGWPAHNQENYKYQKNNFGTNDISNIFTQISHRNDFLFISDSTRNEVTIKILEMHGISGVFNKISSPLDGSFPNQFVFRLK